MAAPRDGDARRDRGDARCAREAAQRRADAERWPALAQELELEEAGNEELQRTKTALADKDKKLEEQDTLLAEQAAELARLRTLSEGVPPEPEPEPEAAQ